MNALQSFEAWISGLLEDRLGGWLGAGLQPVEIAHRLGEYMEDHRTVGAGRRYAPNAYRVYVAPATLQSFAGYRGALQDELASFLQARAREIDVQFVGRVRVSLMSDDALKRERLRIEADLLDRTAADAPLPHEPTQALAVGSAAGGPPPLLLVIEDRRITADGSRRLSLGRALDNDVVIDHLTVSRHHAQLVYRGSSWVLEDLGSSNGSFVNNGRIDSAYVRAGDSVRLGSVPILLLEAHRAGEH